MRSLRWPAPAVLLPLLLPLAVGCPQTTSVVTANTAPTVTVLSPSAGTFTPGSAIPLDCQVGDEQTPVEELEIIWTATPLSVEGGVPIELARPRADVSGFSSFSYAGALAEGTWLIQVVVLDEGDLGADGEVEIEVLGVDDPPQVVITNPVEGQRIIAGDAATFSATAGDDRDQANLVVQWSSDLDSNFGSTAVGDLGIATLSIDNLSPGTHIITAEVTDGGGQRGQDSLTIEVVAPNGPPAPAPAVDLLPDNPVSGDTLSCTVIVPSVDPDGDTVSYLYAWYREGELTPFGTPSLPASATEVGQHWRCVATPTDGILLGAGGADDDVIQNSPATVAEVLLTPDPAYETSELACTPIGWSDPDGHPEGYSFAWLRDSVLLSGATGPSLTGSDFNEGDEISCAATPDDGFDLGSPVFSDPVVIANSPPPPPVIEVQPWPATSGQTLSCVITSFSADPDPTDAIEYDFEWWVDGAPTAFTGSSIPSSETVVGDEWTCRVRARDEIDSSDWAESSTLVVPQPGDLVITEVMVDPEQVEDGAGEWFELFNASAVALDISGFEITDAGFDSHIISPSLPLVVAAGSRVVLGINDNPATNGGIPVAWEYDDVSFDDGFDELSISFLGVEIDHIAWDPVWPLEPGRSMQLSQTLVDDIENDLLSSWCVAATPISGSSDRGTPGTINQICP